MELNCFELDVFSENYLHVDRYFKANVKMNNWKLSHVYVAHRRRLFGLMLFIYHCLQLWNKRKLIDDVWEKNTISKHSNSRCFLKYVFF